jgi:hypothetical protein
MRTRLMVVTAALSLGAAMLIAVSTGAATPTSTSAVTTHHQSRADSASNELPNPAQAAAAYELGSSLAATFPGQYGGITLSNDNANINIYVTSTSSALTSAVNAVAPSGSVNFFTVANSWNSLQSVQQQIEAAQPSLLEQGIDITQFYIEASTNRVVIDVDSLTSTEVAALNQQFGESEITVVPASAANAAIPLTSRDDDSSPFNAGDNETAVHDSDYYQCSSGYGMDISGVPYILTAAHCFPSGASVANELFNTDTDTVVGGGNSMGSVSAVDTTSDGTDSEYLSGEGSDLIWTGAIGSPTKEYVYGLTGVTEGETGICSSGGLDGGICGLTVGTTDNCQTLFYLNSSWSEVSRTACDLIYVDNTSGDAWAGEGDSGGPMYLVNDGNYYGIGLISAGISGDTATCPYNAWSGRTCYYDGYYTSLSSVLSYWGGTLITG